jgi:hypothetical protein
MLMKWQYEANPLRSNKVEGAFVMGLGLQMMEALKYNKRTGTLETDNTWTYKIPTMYDIPERFDVHLVDFTGDRASNGWNAAFGLLNKVLLRHTRSISVVCSSTTRPRFVRIPGICRNIFHINSFPASGPADALQA